MGSVKNDPPAWASYCGAAEAVWRAGMAVSAGAERGMALLCAAMDDLAAGMMALQGYSGGDADGFCGAAAAAALFAAQAGWKPSMLSNPKLRTCGESMAQA